MMRPVRWCAVTPSIDLPALIANIVALPAARSVTRRAPAEAVRTD